MQKLKILSAALTTAMLITPCSVFADPTGENAANHPQAEKETTSAALSKTEKKSEHASKNAAAASSSYEISNPEQTPVDTTATENKSADCNPYSAPSTSTAAHKPSLVNSDVSTRTPSERPPKKRTKYDPISVSLVTSPVPRIDAINDWLVETMVPRLCGYEETCHRLLSRCAIHKLPADRYILNADMYEFLLIHATDMFFFGELNIPENILQLLSPSEWFTLRAFPLPRELMSPKALNSLPCGHMFKETSGRTARLDRFPCIGEANLFLQNHPAATDLRQLLFKNKDSMFVDLYENLLKENQRLYLRALRVWFMRGYEYGIYTVPPRIVELWQKEKEQNEHPSAVNYVQYLISIATRQKSSETSSEK